MALLRNMSLLVIILVTYFALARSKRSTGGDQRMINGKEADIRDWQFLASIKYLHPNATFKICSATLINKNTLITAAHCVYHWRNKPDEILVYIPRRVRSKGSPDNYKWTTSFHFVKKIKVHPRFDYWHKFRSWDGDIAQIEIYKRAAYYIKPMPIADVDDSLRNCKTAGWGSRETLLNGGQDVMTKNYKISKTLQEVAITLTPWKTCHGPMTKSHEEFAKNNSMVFCGIGKEIGSGGCIGDSGSPLICDSAKGKVFSGIMLGGDPKCTPRKGFIIFNDVKKQDFTTWP